MKRDAIYLILLLIVFFLGINPYLIYGAPVAGLEKAGQLENKDAGDAKTEAELDEQALKEDKEEIEGLIKHSRMIYEKLAKRTKECKDMLDSEFFTVNSYARKAIEAKDFRSEREFVNVLSDYNSVLGDIGLMQVILELGRFAEGEKFLDYYNLMESGYERLKDSFSLKNELFLKRIDELRNQNASRYEKKLLREYKGYFEYDPRLEKTAEVGAGDGVKPGNMENKKQR